MAQRLTEVAISPPDAVAFACGFGFLLGGSTIYRVSAAGALTQLSVSVPEAVSACISPYSEAICAGPGLLSSVSMREGGRTCSDPSHSPEKIYWKSADDYCPTLLCVLGDGTVAAQIHAELVLLARDGSVSHRRKTTEIYAKAAESRDGLLGLIDSEGKLWAWNWREGQELTAVASEGERVLSVCGDTLLRCGMESGHVGEVSASVEIRFDVASVLPEDSQLSVHSLFPLSDDRLLVCCLHHCLLLSDWTVVFLLSTPATSEFQAISPSIFAAFQPYSQSIALYALPDTSEEETYEDDFESEGEAEAPRNVPRSAEVTVAMKFEPAVAGILSLATKPQLKKNAAKGKKGLQNLPVTFHKKVKSSGYNTNPKGKNKPICRKAPAFPAAATSVPVNPDPMNAWQGEKLYNSAVFTVAYSPDGGKLAVCGSDSTGFIVKLPLCKFKGERTPLIGHIQSVHTASWSCSSTMVLTSSLDGCSKLWTASGSNPGQCLLSLPFPSAHSQFYYKDRFLAVTDIEKLRLISYKLTDPTEKDDIKRLQSRCKFKERAAISHPSAQSVACFVAQNQFYSHIVVLAGSNKTLSVWDVERMEEVRTVEDPHRKAAHWVRMRRPAGEEPNFEDGNLLFTAAADSEIHLFDLRVSGLISSFSGHVNTSQELTGDLNSAFLAYGSEDRSAYLWDLRSSRLLERIRGFRDVVSSVDFSPSGALAVGTYDGVLSFYTG